MSGRDLGGAYRTSEEMRAYVRDRHEALRAANRCINGPLEDRPSKRLGIVHGPVVPGTGKCARCIEVARRSRI